MQSKSYDTSDHVNETIVYFTSRAQLTHKGLMSQMSYALIETLKKLRSTPPSLTPLLKHQLSKKMVTVVEVLFVIKFAALK